MMESEIIHTNNLKIFENDFKNYEAERIIKTGYVYRPEFKFDDHSVRFDSYTIDKYKNHSYTWEFNKDSDKVKTENVNVMYIIENIKNNTVEGLNKIIKDKFEYIYYNLYRKESDIFDKKSYPYGTIYENSLQIVQYDMIIGENNSSDIKFGMVDNSSQNYIMGSKTYYYYELLSKISIDLLKPSIKKLDDETLIFLLYLLLNAKYKLNTNENFNNEWLVNEINIRIDKNKKIINNIEIDVDNANKRINKNKIIACNILLLDLNRLLYFISNNNDINRLKKFLSYTEDYILPIKLLTNYILVNEKYFDIIMSPTASQTYININNKYPNSLITPIINDNIEQYVVDFGNNKQFIFYDNYYIKLPNCIKEKKYLFKLTSKGSTYSELISVPLNDNDKYENSHTINIKIDNISLDVLECFQDVGIKKYVLIRKTSNKKLDNILYKINSITNFCICWKDTINENTEQYKIELPVHYNENNEILELDFINNELYYNDYIIGSDIYLFNRFVYDIPNVFVLNKGNEYKLLLINYNSGEIENLLKNTFNSNWINLQNKDSVENLCNNIIKSYNQNAYYIIDIHYTGLFLNFNNSGSFISYFIGCNHVQNVDILDILYTSFSHLLPNKDIETLLQYPNTPYNFYFDIKYNFITLNRTFLKQYFNNDNITELSIRNGYYIDKYKFKFDNNFDTYNTNFNIKNYLHNFVQYLKKKKQIRFIPDTDYTDKISSDIDNDIFSFIDYNDYSEKSKGEFFKCEFNNKINLERLKSKFYSCNNKVDQKIKEIYNRLENIDFSVSIKEIINNNSSDFYNLLELSKIHEICSKLNRLLCNNNQSCCDESLIIASVIDEYYVYAGDREKYIMLFELLFGNLIRNDQYEKFYEITKEIDNKENYKIHQMLMGKGKTSVITPLLIFKYLFSDDTFNNLIIVLPKHLINQTHDMIVKKYGYIMNFIKIIKMNIKRNTNIRKISSFFIQLKDEKQHKINSKNVIITDITSLQSIMLNCVENKENIPFSVENTLFIFDEIDSLSDPLSNELNYPIYNRINNEYTYTTMELIVLIIMELSKYGSLFTLDTNKIELSIDNIINNVIIKYNWKIDKESPKTKHIMNKIRNTLIIAVQQIYNKDYGFDKITGDNIGKNNFIAIPYGGVDTPISGSEFSDLEIKLVFTSLSYFSNGLRDIDILYIKNEIKKLYNKYQSIPFILEKHKLIIGLGININQIKFNDIDKIEINKHDTAFISYYLINEIFPKYIIQYNKQYNNSFIDIAGNMFSKYKIGFSGTVSNIHMKNILDYDNNKINIFNDINYDNISSGAMYSSILGITQKNKPQIISYDSDINIDVLSNIVNFIISNNFDVLIDTGAILRNIKPIDVINRIMKYNTHKTYVYIDENDKPKYITSDDRNQGNLFIYYDQKHTIGIDILQPYEMKGLVTINYFNRFTDISQGLYRLRKMNYGHTADFMLFNINEKITNAKELLLYLLKKDNIYKQSTYQLALLQQIKYLRRKSNANNHNLYIDKTFNEIDYINTYDDLKKDQYNKYIIEEYCKEGNKFLCEKINKTTYSMLNTQTSIEEQQQIIVSEQVSVNIQQQMSRNYNIFDYSKLIVLDNTFKWSLFNYFSTEEMKSNFSFNYLEFDNEYKNILTILNNVFINQNIYLSPSIFSDNFDILDNRENVLNKNIIDSYNYYFIQINDGILLIKGWESVVLLNYLKETKIENFIIKNKNGEIINNVNNIAMNANNKHKLSFVKYLIGGIMSLIDIFNCAKFLVLNTSNINEIDSLLNLLEYYMLTITKTDSVRKLISKFNNQNLVYNEKNYDEFIKNNIRPENIQMFIGDIYDSIDIDLDQIKLILDNYLDKNIVGGKSINMHMYNKYIKYKNKYLNIMK
jgi:hypothetical protein